VGVPGETVAYETDGTGEDSPMMADTNEWWKRIEFPMAFVREGADRKIEQCSPQEFREYMKLDPVAQPASQEVDSSHGR
jgi:hypothetical protein